MLRTVEPKKEENLRKKINARFQQQLNMLCSPVKITGANLVDLSDSSSICTISFNNNFKFALAPL